MPTREELEAVRLVELAVEQALGPLSPDAASELHKLRQADSSGDPLGFEAAAAAIMLARQPPLTPLPPDIKQRLLDQAQGIASTADMPPRRHGKHLRWIAASGWALAAAATIAAITLVIDQRAITELPRSAQTVPESLPLASQPREAQPPAESRPVPAPTSGTSQPARPLTTAAQRDRLLADGRSAFQRRWRAGGDPAGIGVTGDVVWDPDTQRGYMRFVGLRKNDPSFEQYQLWIIDASRDERFPIDGGVFDSPGGDDEFIVPIRTQLPVRTPILFGVTLERPGGVVVSDRSRLVVIAQTS